MSAWAKPGVKCVCVDDAALGTDAGIITKGKTYTVRSSDIQTDWLGHTALAIRLVEVVRDQCPVTGQADMGFRVSRFRPLITRTQEQDLELFRPLLTDLPVGVDA